MDPQPIHLVQPSFARGEVSPFLFGRVDLATYNSSLRTLRNAFVRPEGAVSNRPGFAEIGNSLSNTPQATKQLPFVFSATQSYVIEVGNLTAQVFSQGALVLNGTGVGIASVAISFVPGVGYLTTINTTAPLTGGAAGANFNIQGVVGTGSYNINGEWVINTFTPHFGISIVTFYTGLGAPSGAYTSGGTISLGCSFATPWAAADLPKLRYAQSSDTLTVVHPNYPPYEIKRTSANSFTCLPANYTFGPFLPQNTDGVTFVKASVISGTTLLTASAPIFNANHVGSLFQLQQQDLSLIPPWEANKILTTSGGVAGIIGLYRRASLKNYKCVGYPGTGAPIEIATGSFIPSHSQGTQSDGDGNAIPNFANACGVNWLYQDSGTGIVLITGYISATQVTGIVQPNYQGGPGLLPLSVVGGPVVVFGPFNFTGDGTTTTFNPLTGATSADPTRFYVTVGGVYSPPSNYSISLGGGNSITFNSAPANGAAIVVEQITSLGQTTYWAFGAIGTSAGYPSTVTYFPDRLIFGGTTTQPVGLFGSQTSQYHIFQVNNPVLASDAFTVFLNARQLNAISDLIPLSDLLVGTNNIIWRIWAGSTGTAIGPLSIAATPQSYYGQSPNCASILFGDSAIFPEYDGRRLRDLIYQFAYDKFLGQELTLYSRHLIPFGTQFQRLAYKPDVAAQFVLGLLSNGSLIICSYLREQQVIGWARWDTQGTFEDIVVVPEPVPGLAVLSPQPTSYSLYAIINRTINGQTVRYIERQSLREVQTVYDYKFLDCSLTYDGRNASSTTMKLTGGSTWQAGDTPTLTASSTSGWANFLSSDVTQNNEIWLFGQLNFTTNVTGCVQGVLSAATTPGTYPVIFSDGECRSMTIAIDGITCTWFGVLGPGSITSCAIRCRALLTNILSPIQATVRLRDPCPVFMQGLSTATWTFARTAFGDALNLAGMPAVAYQDGNVFGMSSTGVVPNGLLTVGLDGSVTLPTPGGVVQIGLPYVSDFETLPLNQQGQETLRERAKVTPVVFLDVYECRNFLAGTDFTAVSPKVERSFEPYTASTQIQQGALWTRIQSELTAECHTCVRQNLPLPITIRMHIPQVTIGEPIS